MATSKNRLDFEGCNYFRQRLVMATLSGKSVKIKKIRSKDDNPGLKDFEASFIRLLDKVTNGSLIEVNEAGTGVFYQPGTLIGGSIDHDCSPQRAIGYYLEGLIAIAPFAKRPIKALLRGVTNNQYDPSVDQIKLSSIPVLKRFIVMDEGLEIKITKRGSAPGGGGEVHFSCPTRQKLRPLQLTDPGKVKRIRGVAWATRVSPAVCNRVVDSTRSVLNKIIPDIYIYTDHQRGLNSGKSPGFGLTLVAETTTGVFMCAELTSNPQGSREGPTVPEDLGRDTAVILLAEIFRGGCVDSSTQSLALLMMALGDKDVSKVKLGPLSPYTIQYLRHIRDFFQVMFKIDMERPGEDDDGEELKVGGDKVIMTCVGAGFKNVNKITS